jgi:catechol 2,3-dioxygenase-like lactoylglutathione lyase family enzyme
MMQAREVLETCLYADDLEAAERFYREVLGLEFYSRQPGRHVFFRCGRQMVLIFNPAETERPVQGMPSHGARGPGHAAFAATAAEIDEWRDHLTSHGLAIETEIDWPGGGKSLYFRDPAGNSLEIGTRAIWGLS